MSDFYLFLYKIPLIFIKYLKLKNIFFNWEGREAFRKLSDKVIEINSGYCRSKS